MDGTAVFDRAAVAAADSRMCASLPEVLRVRRVGERLLLLLL